MSVATRIPKTTLSHPISSLILSIFATAYLHSLTGHPKFDNSRPDGMARSWNANSRVGLGYEVEACREALQIIAFVMMAPSKERRDVANLCTGRSAGHLAYRE